MPPEERPDQFTAHLAGALNTLASSLRDAGHNQDGVEVVREVVVLYRRLAEASPTHLPDLTMMLGNLSYALVDVGRGDEAVRAAEEALGIWEQLAAQSPDDYQRLGFTLSSFINALAASERREEAHDVASQTVTIWEDLEAQGRGGYLTASASSPNAPRLTQRSPMIIKCDSNKRNGPLLTIHVP